ncbi:DUF6924 domain-containing protein [Kitasatospora sp. NPDC057198]|uniref:DUF6924 domain-containing protein n=1 Tax=Kitasatospora sp. NPDC057198 TaxID=3346046 RepID=UPI00362E1B9E
MALPEPEDLTSLVLRTDFSSDAAWEVVRAAIDGVGEYCHATYVSDRSFNGMSAQALVDAAAAAGDELRHLFVADAITMTDEEHPVLAVDLHAEPGRTFRVAPRCFVDVSANLTIANMDFAEFADAADASGMFRGFAGG